MSKQPRLFQQAAPYAPDPWWYTLLILLRDIAILLSLMFGFPLLIWLLWGQS